MSVESGNNFPSEESDNNPPQADLLANPFRDGPQGEVLFLSENIIDIAGYRTPDMADGTVTTKGWIAEGSTWKLSATKAPYRKNNDQPVPDVSFVLTEGPYGEDDVVTRYNTQQEMAQEKIDYLLEALATFRTDSALYTKSPKEDWTIDERDKANGVAQVDKRWASIVMGLKADFGFDDEQPRKEPSEKVKRGIIKALRNLFQ